VSPAAASLNDLETAVPQGLTEVARMLADGTITARIHSIIQPDQIGEIREKLHHGDLHGKAVIRF
jgi:D-arabinose 1-dehydrogenase-like Zn-dependent alcohol dehydrogenase